MSTEPDDGRSPDSKLLSEDEAAGNLTADRTAVDREAEERAAGEARQREAHERVTRAVDERVTRALAERAARATARQQAEGRDAEERAAREAEERAAREAEERAAREAEAAPLASGPSPEVLSSVAAEIESDPQPEPEPEPEDSPQASPAARLRARPRGVRTPVAEVAKASPQVITTRNLTKVFRSESGDGKGLKAVDSLDLSVCRGEIFGLLGPNGAGKTTTVGMLTTRVIPTSGQALVNGVDVVANPPLAKHFIGVVHQLNTLDRSLTAWENLYFHGRYYGMSAKASKEAADEQLERFRLTHRARSEVRTLSGGMARRLMVARAVLHRPAVLFLDEPTASLDPQSRVALWELLGEIHAEGQTILVTTHYMEEAEEFCDRVAIMDHGKILALDTPAHLKRSLGNGEGTTFTVRAWLGKLRAKALATEPDLVDEKGLLHHGSVETALMEVVDAADRLGLSLEDVRRGVTLETVFFNLTGRDLRE